MKTRNARSPTTGFEDVVVFQQQKPGASSTNRYQCFYNIETPDALDVPMP